MKEIKLTQGFVALVDDEDFEYLNQWKWCVNTGPNTHYAYRRYYIKRKYYSIRLHQLLLVCPPTMLIDHIDRNGLNNQKSNLRLANKSQNAKNKYPYGLSSYLGVSFVKRPNKIYIRAQISINGKNTHIGHFPTEELAAMAYDKAAKKYHGEFANLNFKQR